MRLSAEDIAVILGMTERRIRQIALKENWPYTEKAVRGGKKKFFDVFLIPNDEVKKRILKEKKIEESPEIWEVTLKIVIKRYIEGKDYEA